MVPFRTFRGPLFSKQVTGQELFFAVSYSKPALIGLFAFDKKKVKKSFYIQIIIKQSKYASILKNESCQILLYSKKEPCMFLLCMLSAISYSCFVLFMNLKLHKLYYSSKHLSTLNVITVTKRDVIDTT